MNKFKVYDETFTWKQDDYPHWNYVVSAYNKKGQRVCSGRDVDELKTRIACAKDAKYYDKYEI